MNYMFLKQCVESRPFAPIQQQWLDSIDARILPKLKKSPEASKMLQELHKEVSDDFHTVIVKHTGTVLSVHGMACLRLQSTSKLQVNHASLCHIQSLQWTQY